MCRKQKGELEFFLVHPGGPFFSKKNEGAWGIPKGLQEGDEDLLTTAQREFVEETGIQPVPPFHPLGFVRMKSGKVIYAWSFLGSWDPDQGLNSNIIKIEWPARSGRFILTPEIDRAAWMDYRRGCLMIISSQTKFLEQARLHYQ